MKHEQDIDNIVQLVLRLSEILVKIDGANPNDLWQLHPDREATAPFVEAKTTINEIFELVRKVNGDMLSDDTILTLLLYGAATLRLQINISDNELTEIARQNTKKLINYKASRDVDVPIVSLNIGKEPYTFGPIMFHPISPADKLTGWWNQAKSTVHDNMDFLVLSYARVNVPGDSHRAIDNAAALVRESLLLLRGIGFPITTREEHQFGILNEYPIWRSVPFSPNHPNESERIDAQSNLVIDVGPALRPHRLHEDILSNINPERLNLFLSLINNYGFSPKGELQSRVLSGFRWLGEASKPDTLDARFAKLAFSLEAFIGGEGNTDTLTTKGITAMLAERAAFLVGIDLETRKKIDSDIKYYYKLRSAIAHGRPHSIDSRDFEKFGGLVREIGWSLLEKIDILSNVEGLQKWVFDLRYSA
ncbi:MAG: hypothetical protein ACYC36_17020 [Bellilinea sp.]